MNPSYFPQHPHSATHSKNNPQLQGIPPQFSLQQPQHVQHYPVTPPPHNERIMYKSTIQPQSFPLQQNNGLGLGRLEFMGRNVHEDVETPIKQSGNNVIFKAQNKPVLTFRSNNQERTRMISSVIFPNSHQQASQNFPGLQIPPKQENQGVSAF